MQTTDKLSALSDSTLGDIIAELGKQFVKTDGSNATKAGTKAILGKLTGNEQVAKVSDLNTPGRKRSVAAPFPPKNRT